VLFDAVTAVENFISVFIGVYVLLIIAYILTSWLRLPYSPTVNRIQRFLYDVCEPYLRLFRRLIPSIGPIDLSPMVGIIVLYVVQRLIITLIDRLH
jgi:YggT family protein